MLPYLNYEELEFEKKSEFKLGMERGELIQCGRKNQDGGLSGPWPTQLWRMIVEDNSI